MTPKVSGSNPEGAAKEGNNMIKDNKVLITSKGVTREYPNHTMTKGGKIVPYLTKLHRTNGKRERARRIRQFLKKGNGHAKGH